MPARRFDTFDRTGTYRAALLVLLCRTCPGRGAVQSHIAVTASGARRRQGLRLRPHGHEPTAALPAVFDALWSAGEELGLAHYGSFAMNAMRMEKMFKGASELTTEVTLPEADAMRFASLDKPGGFIGRAATRQSAERRDRPWQCAYLEVDVADAD